MRHLSKLVLLAVLATLCASPAYGLAVTTSIALTGDTISTVNKVQTAATINSTENIVTITIGTKPRTIMFVADTAWIYRSSASGTDLKIAAGQTLTLEISGTTTFYFVRQSADGTLSSLVLR